MSSLNAVDLRVYVELLDKLGRDQPKPEDDVYQFCSPDSDETKEDEDET